LLAPNIMNSYYGEAKPAPRRERDAHRAQDARATRDGDAARAPSKDERDGELYNLPFTD